MAFRIYRELPDSGEYHAHPRDSTGHSTPNGEDPVEFHFYTRAVRRRWRSILALLLIGVLVGAGFALLQKSRYTATAQAYISTGSAANLSDLSQGNAYTEQVVTSYAHIATTGYVLREVITELGLKRTVSSLAHEIAVTVPPGTSVLEVAVTDRSARVAARVADAVVLRLQNTVTDLTAAGADDAALIRLTSIDAAAVPENPSSPGALLLAGAGGLAGLVLGLVLAVFRQLTDVRLRASDEIAEAADAPVLGELLRDPSARKRPLTTLAAPTGTDAEAYRSLATNLLYLDPDGRTDSVVITSPTAAQGKSVLSANLAVAVRESGRRVVLVDADLRRPTQARLFGIDGSVGLSDVLVGRVELNDALQEIGSVHVLPAGTVPPNPVRLLESEAMGRLIATLTERFDVVIFDTPPLLAASDAALLARRTSGAVLAGSVRSVKRHEVRRAVEVLTRIDSRLLGVVATMLPRRERAAYAYPAFVEPARGEVPAPFRAADSERV